MAQKNKKTNPRQASMIFQSFNYKLLALGLILITAGFTAMYIENEVNGIISLFISPIVIMAGYVTIIFAIMVHTSDHQSTDNQSTN